MANESPRRLGQKIVALQQFREAYEAYLDATRGGGHVKADEEKELRRVVASRIPAAEAAMTVHPFVLDPRGVRYIGLGNLTFLDEQGVPTGSPVSETVFDALDGSIATLEERRRRERRRRWNPLFWIDKLVRALLALPAYLVGVIVGKPTEQINSSSWGLPLRLLAVAVDVALVIVGGRQVGWW